MPKSFSGRRLWVSTPCARIELPRVHEEALAKIAQVPSHDLLRFLQIAHVALVVSLSPTSNDHELAETCRRGMPLTPKTSSNRCCLSVSVVIFDVTFKHHCAHDQARIATRDCLAQRGPLRERCQDRRLELGRCRKLHVECGLLLRRSLWRLRLVSLSGLGTLGNTCGNQDARTKNNEESSKHTAVRSTITGFDLRPTKVLEQAKKTKKNRVAL